jgi:hypothetical protein
MALLRRSCFVFIFSFASISAHIQGVENWVGDTTLIDSLAITYRLTLCGT